MAKDELYRSPDTSVGFTSESDGRRILRKKGKTKANRPVAGRGKRAHRRH